MIRHVPLLLVFAFAAPPLHAGVALDKPVTADICGMCHRDIYRMWKKSVHAMAVEDPVFLATYREAQSQGDEKSVEKCLSCHAPMVQVNGDDQLREKLTWEGVNCDFCHGIVDVDLSGIGPRFRLDIGATKRGPIENASSVGHEVAHSPLHRSSIICAPCHEYVNPDGNRIMATYSEWRESSAAKKGKTCQHCHMNITEGNVVDPRIKRSQDAKINLHEMPGGRSIEQLIQALKVTVEPTRGPEVLDLAVTLKNRGAGHAVPTGMPGRRVLLRVQVDTEGGKTFEDERSYGRTFADATGATVTRDVDFFARGVRLTADNRIAADETREERFTFPVPTEEDAYVTVKLHYEHAPRPGDLDRTWLTFFSERRLVRP